MIFNIVISHSFISNYFVGREVFDISAQNILLGIFHYKGLPALWYIFDLIVFALAAPVIELLISRKTTAILSIVAIMVLSQFGITLPETMFFDGTSIIYYMIGAFIGKYYFQEFMKKSKRRDIIVSTVVCVIGIVFQYSIVMEWIQLPTVLHVMLLAAIGISLWKLLDLMTEKIENIGFMKDSFLVYVIHGNLASIVTKLIYIVFPKSAYFAIPNYLLTAVTVLLLIHTFCYFMKRYANPVYEVISGSRNG